MTLYDQVAASPEGGRRLARAELRYKALGALRRAVEKAGISQSELAERLGVRKSAVSQVLNGTGNVQINTLAEYLHEAGYEAEIMIRPCEYTRPANVIQMSAYEKPQLSRGHYGTSKPRSGSGSVLVSEHREQVCQSR